MPVIDHANCPDPLYHYGRWAMQAPDLIVLERID